MEKKKTVNFFDFLVQLTIKYLGLTYDIGTRLKFNNGLFFLYNVQ